VVARAIYAEQATGGRVWLDATHLSGTSVSKEFPSIYETCRAYGIDADRELIPVTPAAHYHMGGIAVNLDGRASVGQLWAAGGAARAGLHGAKRLASNSLLEAVVFGRRVAQAVNRERPEGRNQTSLPACIEWDESEDWTAQREL